MTNYVLGFYFDQNMQRVVMIEKNKPKWQEGLLNGVGGKIEDFEIPIDAMRRKFKEETGVDVEDWTELGFMGNDIDWTVHVFYRREAHISKFNSVRTITPERIQITRLDDINMNDCISNVPVMICAVLDRELSQGEEKTPYSLTMYMK